MHSAFEVRRLFVGGGYSLRVVLLPLEHTSFILYTETGFGAPHNSPGPSTPGNSKTFRSSHPPPLCLNTQKRPFPSKPFLTTKSPFFLRAPFHKGQTSFLPRKRHPPPAGSFSWKNAFFSSTSTPAFVPHRSPTPRRPLSFFPVQKQRTAFPLFRPDSPDSPTGQR